MIDHWNFTEDGWQPYPSQPSKPPSSIWAWFSARYPVGTLVGYERRGKQIMFYAKTGDQWEEVNRVEDGDNWTDGIVFDAPPSEAYEAYGILSQQVDDWTGFAIHSA